MRIFPPNTTSFTNNGDGVISDALSCVVEQTINGAYELTMTYPVDGARYSSIALRGIILASVDPASAEQPFRIYSITKPLRGVITVYAQHLAYDLQGIVLNPFSANNLTTALSGLRTNASTSCPFTFTADRTVSTPFVVSLPYSIWQVMGGQEGSLLDVYTGEYEFDGYTINFPAHRGSDRGVSIAYGKNLTSFSQEENNAAVYTGVYPYWTDGETSVVLPEKIVNAPGTYDFTRILSLDLSSSFAEAPTEAQLRARAEAYITDNDIGVPKVSMSIGFTEIAQAGIDAHIYLGDTVKVVFPRYNVSAKARVVSVRWNPLLNRYDEITLGSVKQSLAKTIADQEKEIEEKPSSVQVNAISSALTKALMGANGGTVRLLDTNGDGEPDELYIADNPDPAQAVKVWRWNYNGWGASSSGYAGPYTMGATFDDGIIADFIRGGTIDGALVNAKQFTVLDENDDVVAVFDAAVTLGRSGEATVKVDYHALSLIDANGNVYAFMGDERDESGTATAAYQVYEGSAIARKTYTIPGLVSVVSATANGTALTYTVSGNAVTVEGLITGNVIIIYKTTEVVPHYTFGTRGSGEIVGERSFVIGRENDASGADSLAVGLDNEANGNYSVALGARHSVTGPTAAALGGTGNSATGYKAVTIGGEGLKAGWRSQVVFGEYNIEDTQRPGSQTGLSPALTKGHYIEIVGNGSSSSRSNARTLDWDGNEWIQGGLMAGGNIRGADGSFAAVSGTSVSVAGNGTIGGDLSVAGSITSNSFAAIDIPGTSIGSGADLNDFTTPGTYFSSGSSMSASLSNTPITNSGFKLVVEIGYVAGTTPWIHQTAYNGNVVWRRYRTNNSVWSDWTTISIAPTEAAQLRKLAGTSFQPGDVLTIGNLTPVSGFVTSGAAVAVLTVPVSKSLEDVSGVTVTAMTGGMRGVSGYVDGTTSSTDWLANAAYTIAATIVPGCGVLIQVTKSSAMSNVTNNTPVVFPCNSLELTFS